MEQEQEVELVFRRVRVVDESGVVLWVKVQDAKGVTEEDQAAA